MVLKGVNLLQNAKIWSNGLERSQLSKLGTQCKNQFIWSGKELSGYTLIKLGQKVLKADNCVHNDKIWSNGLERSQLGTQYKNQVIWS